ncbi:MAG: acyl-phosphate glycerol 3-phosphate acyltransferase [Alphaproteobacteria bacterium CG11_big_fil_rev_8_21_14_0_20_44_7]|nr:MAG: acyl-phosphate glycerol 3-phosphate acyltransferase [Alphaproteobacteria bacterium CG11_big_fil_rev_8_21_14_0_20_44_7]
MQILIITAISFLIGSIPFAIVISKLAGLGDITKFGSGNPGATNMVRFGGKKLAAATLILDALKGALAVWIASQFGLPALAFVAVIFGHCFSIFLKFKGGKGVATTFGALLVLNWVAGLAALGIWLCTFLIFRISSVAALTSINLMVIISGIFWYEEFFWEMLAIAVLVTIRHHSNIRKLIKGEEK